MVGDWKPQLGFCSRDGGKDHPHQTLPVGQDFVRHISLLLSSKPHNTDLQLGLLAPFCRWGNCSSERLHNMPKATQLRNGRAQLDLPATPGFCHTPWHLTSVFRMELMRSKKQYRNTFIFMDHLSILTLPSLNDTAPHSPPHLLICWPISVLKKHTLPHVGCRGRWEQTSVFP